MEEAATSLRGAVLDEGSETVGTMISVKHMSATPVTMEVCAKATLTEVDGKRLVFDVVAEDEAGIVGAGTHERFIVTGETFCSGPRPSFPPKRKTGSAKLCRRYGGAGFICAAVLLGAKVQDTHRKCEP